MNCLCVVQAKNRLFNCMCSVFRTATIIQTYSKVTLSNTLERKKYPNKKTPQPSPATRYVSNIHQFNNKFVPINTLNHCWPNKIDWHLCMRKRFLRLLFYSIHKSKSWMLETTNLHMGGKQMIWGPVS